LVHSLHLSSFLSLPFLKWLQQALKFHTRSCIESTSTMVTLLILIYSSPPAINFLLAWPGIFALVLYLYMHCA
jgi:hypothetical protein